MNLIIIALIVFAIILCSRGPERERDGKRRRQSRRTQEEEARIQSLTHRVGVLEEILLDRDRRLRGKFRDL